MNDKIYHITNLCLRLPTLIEYYIFESLYILSLLPEYSEVGAELKSSGHVQHFAAVPHKINFTSISNSYCYHA